MQAEAPLTAAKSLKSARLGELRLVRESTFAATTPVVSSIRSPRDAFLFLQPFAAREVAETFWILALDSQHNVILGAPIAITRGLLDTTLVHPREVFRAAIVAGAAAVIVAHNHPSGDPTPSAADRQVTEQLAAAGRILDIPVQDHIICGDRRFTSFAETGLL